jgi:hypothetical protein
MTKRALIVGINWYEYISKLIGCVADAASVNQLLKRNADGSPNYHTQLLTCDDKLSSPKVTRAALRAACANLFKHTDEVLLYFSGHGALSETGGYLATSDARRDDWGIPMEEVIRLANRSKARDILIILDCCHAGELGNLPSGDDNPLAVLRENVTIIAASRSSEVAMEKGGHGLFTAGILDALDGGASDHMGWVTAPSIYAYVERRFGGWEQRPIYKSHATGMTVVRQCAPLIERLKLHELVKHFPAEEYKYRLTPEHEPEDEHGRTHKPVDKEKVKVARLFKEYRDVGLLKATKAGEQFYWVARRRHTVELTLRGREYWRLVTNGVI